MGQAYEDRCDLESAEKTIRSLKRRNRELRAIVEVLNRGAMNFTELKMMAKVRADIRIGWTRKTK